MKGKHIWTNFLACSTILVTLACGVQSKDKTPTAKEPIELQETIHKSEISEVEHQQTSGRPIDSNTSFLYGYSTVGFPSMLTNEGSNECIEEMFDELSPKLLRFPGGTVGNFYHVDGPGYGFVSTDLDKIDGSQIGSFMKRQFDKQGKMTTGANNFIYPFVDFIKGKNLSVLLVANIYTGTTDEMLKMIEIFKGAGIEISGVELGNECYLNAYRSIIPTGDEYLKVIEPFRQVLRKQHPDLKIGIVAAPTNWHKESGKKRERQFEEWNKAISNSGKADAVITHIYTKIACEGSLDEEYECAEKKLRRFNLKDLVSIYEHYGNLFESQEIWITEWNIKKANDHYGNTFLQTTYITDFMNTSFEFSRKNNVKMLLTYHNLCGGVGGAGNSLMSAPRPTELHECGVKKRAAFFAFDALNSCYAGLDSIQYLSPSHIRYFGNGSTLSLMRNSSADNIKLKLKSKTTDQIKSYLFESNYLGNGPMISDQGSKKTGEVTVGSDNELKKSSKKAVISPYQMVVINE